MTKGFQNEMLFVILKQGFEAIIDTKQDYPTTTRRTITLKPGHTVLVKISKSVFNRKKE